MARPVHTGERPVTQQAVASEHDLRTVPKVELHVHLGGSITEATALELAARHGGSAGDLHLDDGRYPARYDGFEPFLAAYLASNAFVRTPDDLALAAARFAAAQAAEGIIHTEVIFTAMIYVRNGMEPRAMWEALRSGLAAGGPDTRIGIVVDAIRDFGAAEAKATLDLVHGADAPIVGLGLTGIEGTVPTADFTDYRSEARRLGLGFEVHAGEMGPPASVVEAIDILEADRIGHGVAASRDPALVDRLVRDRVVLEVCPSSNVAIGLYPSIAEHPVGPLLAAGAQVTISSDDPPFFRTTLTGELRRVAEVVGLGRGNLATLQRTAATAAFLPAEERQRLVARIDAWEAAPVS
jgi:adenosine deaminase